MYKKNYTNDCLVVMAKTGYNKNTSLFGDDRNFLYSYTYKLKKFYF